MKIRIHHPGLKLTKSQRARFETQISFVLARFYTRIDRVIVRLSDVADPPGYVRCQLEVSVDAELVSVEHSDIDIAHALQHATSRATRSVSRAIENQAWLDGSLPDGSLRVR